MSMYGLALSGSKSTQRTACLYGMTNHPWYHKCGDCGCIAWCEIHKDIADRANSQALLDEIAAWKEERQKRILDPKRLP